MKINIKINKINKKPTQISLDGVCQLVTLNKVMYSEEKYLTIAYAFRLDFPDGKSMITI